MKRFLTQLLIGLTLAMPCHANGFLDQMWSEGQGVSNPLTAYLPLTSSLTFLKGQGGATFTRASTQYALYPTNSLGDELITNGDNL